MYFSVLFYIFLSQNFTYSMSGRGTMPPKTLSGVTKVCFDLPPPKKMLTNGAALALPGSGGQNLCQIASEHPEISTIFKIFRLRPAC